MTYRDKDKTLDQIFRLYTHTYGSKTGNRIMLFVDGENFSARYNGILTERQISKEKDVLHFKDNKGHDVYTWSTTLSNICVSTGIIRQHYYTTCSGDNKLIEEVEDILKERGFDIIKVFKKSDSKSKLVDITLATDMLMNAYRDNYDIAVLIAGDEDYIPLIEAVRSEGKIVLLWFFEAITPRKLKHSADKFEDIGKAIF